MYRNSLSREDLECKKEKNQKSGKHISKKGTYKFEGVIYNVDARNKGLYTPILKKALEILYESRKQWGRVLIIRFDLHHRGLITSELTNEKMRFPSKLNYL